MQRRALIGSLMLALGVIGFGGCASAPTLTHPEHFYLQSPANKTLTYERTLPEDSWIRGTLTVAVNEVDRAETAQDTYRMAGTAGLTTRGRINGREAARAAPRKVVQAAMEPENVPEVFETVSSQPGMTVTKMHWDRLRTLELPIEYEHSVPASAFSSALRGIALEEAAEVALVWHKVLAPFLSIPPFGEYSASAVKETDQTLELTLTQKVPGGAELVFHYSFERGSGLTGLETTMADGSVLRLTTPD